MLETRPDGEKAALWMGVVIFGLVGVLQSWRYLAGIPVSVGTMSVPVWPSGLVAAILLSIAIWYAYLASHHGPLVR